MSSLGLPPTSAAPPSCCSLGLALHTQGYLFHERVDDSLSQMAMGWALLRLVETWSLIWVWEPVGAIKALHGVDGRPVLPDDRHGGYRPARNQGDRNGEQPWAEPWSRKCSRPGEPFLRGGRRYTESHLPGNDRRVRAPRPKDTF